MILSTVAILDPGYGRLTGWLWPEPQSMLMWYFFNFWGDGLVLTAMAAWDAWRGRLMKQFAPAQWASSSSSVCTSITEIAYRWGFNDSAHFSRLFKASSESRRHDIGLRGGLAHRQVIVFPAVLSAPTHEAWICFGGFGTK
jgi:hypothetical protein